MTEVDAELQWAWPDHSSSPWNRPAAVRTEAVSKAGRLAVS